MPIMHTGLFINNEYVNATSSKTLTIKSPHDESIVAEGIQVASEADVDTAVAAARAAFKGPWSKWTASQRSEVMQKFAALTDKHAHDLGVWEAKSMGQPVGIATGMSGLLGKQFRYYAGWTDKMPGEQWPEQDGVYKIVQYDPIGVCAGIGAWNVSHMFFATKVAPAVAMGCTFVFKASEKSPVGVLQLGELVKEAGFPPGVINILSGDGKAGAALASHMDINKISFTGSTAVGKKIQEAATKSNLKRVTLELGGKSPSIVFADANLENAVQHHGQGFLFNSGQICVAASRTFVHEDIAKEFVAKLKTNFEQISNTVVGNPEDASTYMGPVADGAQFERVMNYIEAGKKEAELVTGGARKGKEGFYIEPTIFLNPHEDATIYREEIFGPVITIRTFKTEEEAIRMANDTVYGLASYVFTSSVPRALRVARELDAGNVLINCMNKMGIETPFGGSKQSGVGREGGRIGLMNYVEAKTISINMDVEATSSGTSKL